MDAMRLYGLVFRETAGHPGGQSWESPRTPRLYASMRAKNWTLDESGPRTCSPCISNSPISNLVVFGRFEKLGRGHGWTMFCIS